MMPPMKYWVIVADKLSAAGWSWGYCSAVTKDGWRLLSASLAKEVRMQPFGEIAATSDGLSY
jgi:hypothetical protein